MHSSHLIQVLVTANHQLYPLDTTQSCSYNIEMPPAQQYPGYSYSYFRSQVILFPPTLCPQNPSLAFLIRLSSELLILQWQLWFFLSLLEVGVGWFGGKNLPAYVGNKGDMGWIPGSGRSPGDNNGNPLQYSHLENSMDRGIWLLFGLLILQWNSDFFL